MPSVNIRKTPSESGLGYELFGGSFDNDIHVSSQSVRRQRSMGTFPRRGPPTQTNTPAYTPRMRSHTTSGTPFPAQMPTSYSGIHRSRSRNKITEHILAPRRSFLAPPPSHGFLAVDGHGTIRDRTVTMQGSQTDIVMHTQTGDRTPGIVESVRSLEQSQQLCGSEIHHHDDIVDHLDVIDPQVATVSSLANATNAILIPPSQFYSRKPAIVLSYPKRQRGRDIETGQTHSEFDDMDDLLDRHVESVLTRRDKFKRTLRGVWSFLRTPMGIIVGIYGFLVVFWGAALVLFLLKWIDLHNSNTQGFWVEVCSQIECGLFTVTGIGLIPSRTLDTYRICKIWHYQRKTRKLRRKAGLPDLYDVDDLPDPAYDPGFVHVLLEQEERDLHHHQVKFRESQTWYRPHGTVTHRAFPINTALWICLLVDGNSFFQVILSSCMWSMNRFERPAWTTGTLIPASFLCGIISGVLIWRGGQRTRRTEKIEQILQAALTIEKKEKHNPLQSTENISTDSPNVPLRQTNIDGTNDLTASSENSGVIAASQVVSPAIVEEMIIPAMK